MKRLLLIILILFVASQPTLAQDAAPQTAQPPWLVLKLFDVFVNLIFSLPHYAALGFVMWWSTKRGFIAGRKAEIKKAKRKDDESED